MTDPADALLELAWTERRLAAEGRVDELAALQAERDAAMAALPSPLTPQQVETLRRTLVVHAEIAQLLRQTRDAVAAELGRIEHGRETLRGYTPAGLQPGRTFDAAG
jgi:hypothetical protein